MLAFGRVTESEEVRLFHEIGTVVSHLLEIDIALPQFVYPVSAFVLKCFVLHFGHEENVDEGACLPVSCLRIDYFADIFFCYPAFLRLQVFLLNKFYLWSFLVICCNPAFYYLSFG